MAKFDNKEKKYGLVPEKETVETVKESSQGTMNLVEKFLNMIDKYGVKKIFEAMLLVVLLIFLMIFSFNPDVVFKAYDEYKEKAHNTAMVERLDNTPLIQDILDDYRRDVDASRVAIFELHNSTNSLEGMPFLFASMTYESINPGLTSAAIEFDNLRLSLYPLATYLREHEVWYGKVDDLEPIDHIAWQRLKILNAKYVAFRLLEYEKMPNAVVVSVFNEGTEFKDVESVIEKSYVMTYKVAGLLSVKQK